MTGHDSEHSFSHPMNPLILIGVFVALIILTIVTVLLAGNVPKNAEIIVAMSIATVKGLLVALFFMHLIFDKPLNGVLFAFSLFFVSLFLGFCLMDTGENQPLIQQYDDFIEQRDAG